MISRRSLLTAPALLTLTGTLRAEAQDAERHGLSYFGELKEAPDFKHFAYVNPQAPKGGSISLTGAQWAFNQSPETFNSFNTFILRGDAPFNMGRIFASLMAGSDDEPDSLYGYVASGVTIGNNGRELTFRLNPAAKFHDGSRITAHDVAWTLTTFKSEGHPSLRIALAEMVEAVALADDKLKVTLSEKATREMPLTIAGMAILSKAYYASRKFDETSMEPPLGSGPYKIGKFEQGRYVEYERVKDWWGENLPTMVGLNNFDIIRAEFFRDRDVAFEGFKGRTYTMREEFTSRVWATGYDFPAFKDGKVKKEEIPTGLPAGYQGLYINTRRDKFKNPKAREALMQAFDFEWVNQNIMFNAYTRTASFFEGSGMKAEGKPSEAELKLLEPFRGKVPDEVFGEPWLPPKSDGSGQDRNLLRRASQLFREAGFEMKNNKLLDSSGQQMSLEILMQDNSFERHLAPFIENLKRLGVEATMRRVDPAQFQSRIKEFDFDIISRAFTGNPTPTETGLKNSFGSQGASSQGSSNFAGIADEAVDAMIAAVGRAKTREELNVAARALDRVLRAGRYILPAWYKEGRWYAYWDMFERPARKPLFSTGAPGAGASAWWYSPEKAAKMQ